MYQNNPETGKYLEVLKNFIKSNPKSQELKRAI